MSVKVGIIGIGMMGTTHLRTYQAMQGAKVVAICDTDSSRLNGPLKAWSNVENLEVEIDCRDVRRHFDAEELLADDSIDIVDICVPTDLHVDLAVRALQSGKHVIVEKPVARTLEQAEYLLRCATEGKKSVCVAHCMRFWPGWDYLRELHVAQECGSLLSANFQRVAAHPGGFYTDAARSGGALLDLHIHDTDFIQYCFGVPTSVTSFAAPVSRGGFDHVLTRYEYGDSSLVVAEGAWFPAPAYPFSMKYCVSFERATLLFSSEWGNVVRRYNAHGEMKEIALSTDMGYDRELAYFVECIATGRKPQVVTLEEAVNSLRIIEAERRSIETGQKVQL